MFKDTKNAAYASKVKLSNRKEMRTVCSHVDMILGQTRNRPLEKQKRASIS